MLISSDLAVFCLAAAFWLSILWQMLVILAIVDPTTPFEAYENFGAWFNWPMPLRATVLFGIAALSHTTTIWLEQRLPRVSKITAAPSRYGYRIMRPAARVTYLAAIWCVAMVVLNPVVESL